MKRKVFSIADTERKVIGREEFLRDDMAERLCHPAFLLLAAKTLHPMDSFTKVRIKSEEKETLWVYA